MNRLAFSLALLFLTFIFISSAPAQPQSGATPATQPIAKTLRVMTIGNSFTWNGTTYLREMAQVGGHSFTLGSAWINGATFELHLKNAMLHEANPDDAAGKPYTLYKPDGKQEKRSLKQALLSDEWDYVTIQQASKESYDPASYRPHAQNLIDYVHRYAPNAKIIFHETWAYRPDHPAFKDGKLDPEKMYQELHAAYEGIAEEVGAVGIIPVGTAFHNAILTSYWDAKWPAAVEVNKLVYPDAPAENRTLYRGWYWNTVQTKPRMWHDPSHAGIAGRYLGSAVWYQFFFGDLAANPFVPKDLPAEEFNMLKDIALKTAEANTHPLKVSQEK